MVGVISWIGAGREVAVQAGEDGGGMGDDGDHGSSRVDGVCC